MSNIIHVTYHRNSEQAPLLPFASRSTNGSYGHVGAIDHKADFAARVRQTEGTADIEPKNAPGGYQVRNPFLRPKLATRDHHKPALGACTSISEQRSE